MFGDTMIYCIDVDVVALMGKNGELTPLFIVHNNGMKQKIEKALNKGQRRSEGGGNGILYIVKIEGTIQKLFYNHYKHTWFLEKNS